MASSRSAAGGFIKRPRMLLDSTDEDRDPRTEDSDHDRCREEAFREEHPADQAASRAASAAHDGPPDQGRTAGLPDPDEGCTDDRPDRNPARERNENHDSNLLALEGATAVHGWG